MHGTTMDQMLCLPRCPETTWNTYRGHCKLFAVFDLGHHAARILNIDPNG